MLAQEATALGGRLAKIICDPRSYWAMQKQITLGAN